MDMDKALVSAVIREGRPAIRRLMNRGFDPELLSGEGRAAYDFICEYSQSYGGEPPPLSVLEGKTGIILGEFEQAPTDFWVDEILNRKLYTTIRDGNAKITEALEKGDPKAAEELYKKLGDQIHQCKLGTTKVQSIHSFSQEVLDYYQRIKNGERGILTPWESVNEATFGFWPEDLILFVARVGIGKTWCTVLLAGSAWEQGKKVLYCTTEMAQFRICMRYYAVKLNLPYSDFIKGRLNAFQEKALHDGIQAMKDSKNFNIVGGDFDFTFDSFAAAIDEAAPDIVVLDGAYLLKVEGDTRTERAANAFNELKRICKRYKVPIVVTMQFNREVKANSPSTVATESIALTDVASWNADLIYGLIQTEEMKKARTMGLKPLKVREGLADELLLNWDLDSMNFAELPKISDADSGDYGDSGSGSVGNVDVPF